MLEYLVTVFHSRSIIVLPNSAVICWLRPFRKQMHIVTDNIEFTFISQVYRENDVAIKGSYIIFSHG